MTTATELDLRTTDVDSYIEYSSWKELAWQPLVSIVMPAYNHERYLAEAIDGVLAQETGFPFELLIGEDSSIDDTRAIALEYWRAHPDLIRVLTAERNVGMHENAARMLNAARGRYLAFCEGDDCWHRPDKLRAQVALLESDRRIALVCSSWRTISEDGKVLTADELNLPRNRTYTFDLDEILSGRVKTVTVCTRTLLMQKIMRDSPLCRPGRYPFADAPLWVEAHRQGACVCLPEEYGTYRLSRNSATRPAEIMDVYRFIAAASEFDRTVLGLYPLRTGAEATRKARIAATRKRLRALSLLGDGEKAGEEMLWMSRLGAHPSAREYLLDGSRAPLGTS
jgi:glycosyltransferase involved in cell wall biosynthesis